MSFLNVFGNGHLNVLEKCLGKCFRKIFSCPKCFRTQTQINICLEGRVKSLDHVSDEVWLSDSHIALFESLLRKTFNR